MNQSYKSIKWSHYRNLYNHYIATPSSILEIGVADGGSIVHWLSKGCSVYGIDTDSKCASLGLDNIYIGNVCSPSFIKTVAREIAAVDYVIDDGGHRPYQIWSAFKHLWPICKKAYIIEDTQMLGKFRWRLWEALRLPGLNTILRNQFKQLTTYVPDNYKVIHKTCVHIHPHMVIIEKCPLTIETQTYELPKTLFK